MRTNPLPHSLHDAYIEAFTIGPRREIEFALNLGSACFSDETLPDEAKLRFGAIENFEVVRTFFKSNFSSELYSRINRASVTRNKVSNAEFCVLLDLDREGIVQINCSKIQLTPVDSSS